jgi:hypothetical protein
LGQRFLTRRGGLSPGFAREARRANDGERDGGGGSDGDDGHEFLPWMARRDIRLRIYHASR